MVSDVFGGAYSSEGPKKKACDTNNDRDISGFKDAPDSPALLPSQWCQTI